jgi:hypothetical protein
LAQGEAGAFDFDECALCGILDPAGEFKLGGKAVNKRAETDSLDSSPYDDPGSFKVSAHGSGIPWGKEARRGSRATQGEFADALETVMPTTLEPFLSLAYPSAFRSAIPNFVFL